MPTSRTRSMVRWAVTRAILAAAAAAMLTGCAAPKAPPFKQAAAAKVKIKPDDGQRGVTGDIVPDSAGSGKHYVSPKKPDDFVVLRADVPGGGDFSASYEWWHVGGAEGDVVVDAQAANKVKCQTRRAEQVRGDGEG